MLSELDQEERLRLMRFVCSFAWADLEVADAERAFVKRLSNHLGLSEEELTQVDAWLELPPKAEELDPAEIPRAHREMFLDAIRAVVVSDGRVDKGEVENLALFEMLLQD